MPIKSLEPFLFERGLIGTYPTEILQNARIGIDVDHYISRYLTQRKREAYCDAIGGFPDTIFTQLQSDLKVFKSHNITPIFVLSGFKTANEFDTSKIANQQEVARSRAWLAYQSVAKDTPALPVESFRDPAGPVSVSNYDLISFFIEHNVDYMVAPYISWVQLYYLYTTEYIDTIYGSTDCLLLPIEKFVLDISGKDFRFLDKGKVLKELRLSPEAFTEIAMCCGCGLQPVTFSFLENTIGTVFETALNLVISGQALYAMVLQGAPEGINRFQKGILALETTPVLKENGHVELLKEPFSEDDRVPNNIHEVIGQRLPHEYYFYASLGLINSKLLDAIAFGTYLERPPLDGGDNPSYKKLVKKSVSEFKNNEINLLTQTMTRYYQVKKIEFVPTWFTGTTPLTNRMPPGQSMYEKINKIWIKGDGEFSFAAFMKAASQGIPTGDRHLNSNLEIIGTALFRALHMLGFFENGTPTAWGRVLLSSEGAFSEEILTLLVLLKLDVLKLDEDFPGVSSNLSEVTLRNFADECEYIQIITRLLSLVSVQPFATSYQGPIDKNILTFRSHINYVREQMSELLDSCTVASLANLEIYRDDKKSSWWNTFVHELPFKKQTSNTVLAIVAESYLQKYLHNGGDSSDSLQFVNALFDADQLGLDIKTALSRGKSFAESFIKVVRKLESENLFDIATGKKLDTALQFFSTSL